MVLLEIDASGVFAVEFECNAPRPIHMDSVAGWIEAVKSVEVEAGQVHAFLSFLGIQAVKTDGNALMKRGVDLAGFPGFEEVCQRLVLERLDHGLCKPLADTMSIVGKQKAYTERQGAIARWLPAPTPEP